MNTPTTKDTLFICGSRKADKPMLDYTDLVVQRAKQKGYEIICGDAVGVDEAVWKACAKHGVPFRVYGVQSTPQNKAPVENYEVIRPARTYKQRDEEMLKKADMVMAIWNGESKGTLQIADIALWTGFVLGTNIWVYGNINGSFTPYTLEELETLYDDLIR